MGSWLLEDLETRETRARARRQERCHERRRRLSVYGQRAKRANLQPLTSQVQAGSCFAPRCVAQGG